MRLRKEDRDILIEALYWNIFDYREKIYAKESKPYPCQIEKLERMEDLRSRIITLHQRGNQ